MLRLFALVLGEGQCPACEGGLVRQEPGYHVCESCGVVVVYARGGWRYAGESVLRPLPGLSGIGFDAERERAPETRRERLLARPRAA